MGEPKYLKCKKRKRKKRLEIIYCFPLAEEKPRKKVFHSFDLRRSEAEAETVQCPCGVQELYARSGVTFGTDGGRRHGDCKELENQGGVTSV